LVPVADDNRHGFALEGPHIDVKPKSLLAGGETRRLGQHRLARDFQANGR